MITAETIPWLYVKSGEIEERILRIIDRYSRIRIVIINQEVDNDAGELVAFVELKKECAYDLVHLGSPGFKVIQERVAMSLPSHMRPSLYFPWKLVKPALDNEIFRRSAKAPAKRLAIKERLLYLKELPLEKLSNDETLLASIWLSILDLTEDSLPDADFFMLGGDSIKEMNLISVLRQKGSEGGERNSRFLYHE